MRAQLQRHYDAINERDYAQWRATVVPARAAALGEGDWQEAYASTQDGSIRVERIDPDPDVEPDGGLLVRVRFISTQAVEDAPPDLPVGAHLLALHAADARNAAPDRRDRGRQLRA